MFKNILITAGAKIIQAFFAIIILIINAKNLGAEGVGVISLIILAITLIVLLNNFIGGPALVYLVPRYNPASLFCIAYLWSLVAVIFGNLILNFFQLIPAGFSEHIFLLSMIFSLHTVNLNIILAFEKIKFYNFISLLQVIMLFLLLLIFYYQYQFHAVFYYVISLYFSYGIVYLLSLIGILTKIKIKFSDISKKHFAVLFKYGALAQSTNLFQLLNQRLNYYLLESFTNKALLGVFSAGTQLSEGVLLFSNGAAMVQYARISNSNDKAYNEKITLLLIKFSVVCSLLMVLILMIIPEHFFTFLFSKSFAQVKQVIYYLSLGIIALAASLILSHFFSGTGKLKINFYTSGLGLICTSVAGYVLIPLFGLSGACITFSFACMIMVLFQLFHFFKISHCNITQLLLKKTDIKFLFQLFKEFLAKK